MEKILKREIYTNILGSIVLCIVGLFFMISPVITMNVGLTIVKVTLLVVGILTIINHIRYNDYVMVFNQGFMYGVLSIVLSVFLMVNSSFGVPIVPIIVGIWMVLGSLMKVQVAVNLKDLKGMVSIFTMVSAILMFICGMIAICNPIKFSLVIITLLGTVLVIYAMVEVFNSLFLLDYVRVTKNVKTKPTAKKKI